MRKNVLNKTQQMLLIDMEKYAIENNIPISRPKTLDFILNIINKYSVKYILEIGAAIGYFAIKISLLSDASVVTIERSNIMCKLAKENINKSKTDKVKLEEGDANEVLHNFNKNEDFFEKFDLIYIDAAKSKYMEYFLNSNRLLKPGGFIVSDNVLFRGMVLSTNTRLKKYKTIINNMELFLDFLNKNEQFESSIVLIDDGVSVSRKL